MTTAVDSITIHNDLETLDVLVKVEDLKEFTLSPDTTFNDNRILLPKIFSIKMTAFSDGKTYVGETNVNLDLGTIIDVRGKLPLVLNSAGDGGKFWIDVKQYHHRAILTKTLFSNQPVALPIIKQEKKS